MSKIMTEFSDILDENDIKYIKYYQNKGEIKKDDDFLKYYFKPHINVYTYKNEEYCNIKYCKDSNIQDYRDNYM